MELHAIETSSWDAIRELFESTIPFHQILKPKIEGLESGTPKLRVDMQDIFVGNFVRGNLHGGVISSLLDIIGGIAVLVDLVDQHNLLLTEQRVEQFSKMGTIDMRVDYLRPGFGTQFVATASVLRIGKSVAVTKMELHNCEDTLIAVGTGAYKIA